MKIVRAVAVAVGALCALVAFAGWWLLRDDPARPAAGSEQRALSGDAEIVYYTAGPARGRHVVLLPSFGRSVSDLNELAVSLHESGYRTIGVEPRGVGGSSLPSFDANLHTLAADVVSVLDAEGVDEPVFVVGHAYGNRIARALAARHGARVAGLVLLAAGGTKPTPPETGQAISRALFGIGSRASREEAVGFAFFAKGNEIPEHWLRGWYPRAGLLQSRATPSTPAEEWSGGGNAPILVLEPAEDAAAAGGGEELLKRFPARVSLVRVEGAGHALLPERPALVAREVLAFLGSLQ